MIDKVKTVIYLFLVFTAIIILRNAWVGDDAYIGFRTVYNFSHGYGLTFNINERVQSFTNPLWILLMSVFYFFTGEAYFTTIVLSLVVSLLTLYLLAMKFAVDARTAILIFVIAISSKAFIDYSTSGLENPLGHLFIVLFCIVYFSKIDINKRLFFLFFIASLSAVNRADNLILFFVPLISQIKKINKKIISIIFLGSLPLIIWELFSLLYYGFLLPNTYYTKLHSGIPSAEYFEQGVRYFINSIDFDPVTLLTISIATFITIISSLKNKKYELLPLVISIILYLAYILKIGGDFMSGRFFSCIFLLSIIIITQLKMDWLSLTIFTWLVIAISLISPYSPVKSGENYRIDELTFAKIVTHGGIADERAWYYQNTGLLKINGSSFIEGVERNLEVTQTHDDSIVNFREEPEVLGFPSYSSGPNTYVFHYMGLSDPLIARLPMDRSEGTDWRIGHIHRKIPEGYVETLKTEINQIKDKDLASYYDKLSIIIKGNIFSGERLATIFKMNMGKYESLININYYSGKKR
jgi:arabinofuranosyltransferase